MTMLPRLLALLVLLTGAALVGATPAEAVPRPSPPRAVAASAGDGTATLTWKAPRRGSAIRRYGVQRRDDAGWTTVATVGAKRLVWRAHGLDNGTSYEFRVRALGKARWGKPSAGVEVTPRTVPDAPGAPEADSYASALGLYWKAPASNGAAIDAYRVETSTNGTTWALAVTTARAGTAASPVLLSGLVPGARYWLRVRAHNAAGYGDLAGTGPYTVRTPPGAPTGLSATPGDAQVALTWSAPPGGGPGETPAGLYRVEQSADDGATWSVSGETDDLSYVVTGLTNDAAYLFRVSARSTIVRVGYGPAGATVTATPEGPPLPPALGVSTPALTVVEGGTATFVVELSAPAPVPVVVELASADPGAASVPAPVMIPAGQTSAPVQVAGVGDADVADETVLITATLGTQQVTVTATVTDDDVQALSVISGGQPLTELTLDADTPSFTLGVGLLWQPGADVPVTLSYSGTLASLGRTELTLTPASWQPQPVALELTGTGTETATVTVSSPGLPDHVVTVTVGNPGPP
ncbi:fibronectin type III domain-containing protein [Nocardioides nitrophenolicus]|uniref:fibronectin type III domain-containing protein n=1 Tax=Nocardioides nitrophenolicus TaxID=60489 RepID=UPI00195AEC9E|nr:fibronectin type III domain-containing protein [Nocardioides nitrophenolicus]MBM7519979.1 hypothetical protein [Nocardioides nitrophenolicus]